MQKIILNNPAFNGGELRYEHLLGREFKLGKYDCYDLARCMFKDNLNITLDNYARPNNFWLEGFDLYKNYYESEEFYQIAYEKDARPLDVFLIAVPDSRNRNHTVTNHCAIYLGEGQVIHHRYGCLSVVQPYIGALKNLTTHIVRHKDVPDLTPSQNINQVDLYDLLPFNKRMQLKESHERVRNKN